jgi:hypothetical protein
MAREDSLDIFGSDPFGRDYLYGLSSGNDGMGLAPYGIRYSESLSQPTTVKRGGYLGDIGTMNEPMTELSSSFEVNGKSVQYPLVVPTLTVDELQLLRAGGEPTPSIYNKAEQFAMGRLSRGQDPFATTQDLRYPQPQGLNPAPSTDQMQATPRGFISGLFSDVLGRTFDMPALPRTGIPALDLFAPNMNAFNRLSLGDVQKTAERISYGEPLTTGAGMTLRPRDETIFAGMAVAPFVGEAASLGARAGRAGARMVGQGIAENVAMGRPNLPSMFAEPRSSLFAVEPSPMMPKPQAPVSELGFYSAAEQAALNLPRNKGTGQSFLNDLMKAPDVKKDELAWTGLDDFLKDKPNVTKQEVQDYLANNKVDLQEVQLSGRGDKYGVFSEFNPDTNKYHVYSNDARLQGVYNTSEEADAFVNQHNSQIPYGPSKYDKYQLAGGENYREILLKLPFKEPAMPKGYEVTSMQYDDGTVRYFANTPTTRSQGFRTQEEAQAELSKTASNLKGFRENLESYKSSHFDEPNILAHIRVNDRVDADGKKMLLVEEIQSDWHQAGREKGYAPKNAEAQLAASRDRMAERGNEIRRISSRMAALNDSQLDEFNALAQERQRLQDLQGEEMDWGNKIYDAKNSGVPDAPFKDNWYQLALKRVMKYAADNGYERVGLTTGKQQAKRYDLGDEVNSIDVESVEGVPNLQLVDIDVIGGQKIALEVENGVVREGEFAGKRLSDVVGKEMADKITNVAQGKTKSLAGEDLRLGGEGMKKYYDEIYPKFLEKYGKKWDASVGETQLKGTASKDELAAQVYGRGETYRNLPSENRRKIDQMYLARGEPIRYIDITPKMKEGVEKGQPLFSAAPAGTLGLGGLEYADPFASPLTEDTTR